MLQQTAQLATANDMIKIAILAVGGQGGGVLSDWIVSVAERNGFCVQATSVPGVAQRTGATIYYVEMARDIGKEPIFALMPAPGDIDIVLSAELMEAGRAVIRGLVTQDRTTLITSTHRALAVSEKMVPGDGIADSGKVLLAARAAARTIVAFDMERVAVQQGSVISASLFGALAGSGRLPFPVEAYLDVIRSSGRGVEASIRAFEKARSLAEAGNVSAVASEEKASTAQSAPTGPKEHVKAWSELAERIESLPQNAQDFARRGLEKVVDYQDIAYGGEYLGRLAEVARADETCGGAGKGFALTVAAARHIANAMTYDDVIRVADLKTRASRFDRIDREMSVGPDNVLKLTEFMHPRADEVCGMMPTRIGRWLENSPRSFALLDRLVNRGRRVHTERLFWFLSLFVIGGMRRWRRGLYRHSVERAHLDDWLELGLTLVRSNYELGVEIINCRRLIKGYSDTHARGLSKFDRVMSGAMQVRDRGDAADWVRRMREAALKDEKGEALEGVLQTIASFLRNAPIEAERYAQ